MGYDFTSIEKKWQSLWQTQKTFRAMDPAEAGSMPKRYVLDMFPYPSGAGLHVGHVENYTATDILSRYLRMKGFNVLHPTGWDAFGLPAEQFAIKNNRHPAEFIKNNTRRFREQIQMLGLSYDWDREIDTTDPGYFKWTQWIFLQLFNSYFDPIDQKARPIGHLINELQNENYLVAPDGRIVINPTPEGMETLGGQPAIERTWKELSPQEQLDIIGGQRLAYMDEIPVNWCPALGTVLANEEVIDGRSEVGGFPVERRPMRQWMLRITAYADRLVKDLDLLEWPESLKEMQRNWIGKSAGAEVDFEVAPGGDSAPVITVFTTRPDTLYGATYMVLAPEHPLVEQITSPEQRQAVQAYRQMVSARSERERMADTKEKSGVFTGAYAINPVNEAQIPIYIADYVLMGYGTGAIMAVPAHDQRDFEFAKKFNLPIKAVVTPDAEWLSANAPAAVADAMAVYRENPGLFKSAFAGDGVAINSPVIDGRLTPDAKEHITTVLSADGVARATMKYKLRDWLFSRQRYWGEPFPIVFDADGQAYALPESELPVPLPDMADFKPTGTPEPPLSKAKEWLKYAPSADFTGPRDRALVRETNTMPQWAGSCWYYLRFLDPHNAQRFVDAEKEAYWMPVDLYVGGVEHAVLHLLYARFWHKVLFDLGHVSTPEPFMRLVNQGLILGEVEFHVFAGPDGKQISTAELQDVREEATDQGVQMVATISATGQKATGTRIPEEQVEKCPEGFRLKSNPAIRVDARSFKMSKSRGNVASPNDLVADHGADALRLYVMYMGPLEMQKPWNTRDIVGMTRFLSSVWRNLVGEDAAVGVPKVSKDAEMPIEIARMMHRTIKKVGEDTEALRFNVAIAELIKLNNEMGRLPKVPRALAENFALMLAPFAPHLAEELWQRLGHEQSLARQPWPVVDQAMLVETTLELPVQVNGKLRDKIVVAADASEATILQMAERAEKVLPWLEGKQVRKRLYVPRKLVNLVVG